MYFFSFFVVSTDRSRVKNWQPASNMLILQRISSISDVITLLHLQIELSYLCRKLKRVISLNRVVFPPLKRSNFAKMCSSQSSSQF